MQTVAPFLCWYKHLNEYLDKLFNLKIFEIMPKQFNGTAAKATLNNNTKMGVCSKAECSWSELFRVCNKIHDKMI